MNSPNPDSTRAPQFDSSTIVGRTYAILRRYPRLIIFPTVITVATLVMLWIFSQGVDVSAPLGRNTPPWLARVGTFANLRHPPRPLLLVGYYFSAMFVGTFVNVAFYHELLEVYAGKAFSLLRGLRFACSRIGQITLWTAFAASVGVLFRLIGDKLSWAGRLTGFLLGMGWSVASVFAIPVLVREGLYNPIETVRRSTATVRQTWGGLVYGFFRLGFVPMLLASFLYGASVDVGHHFPNAFTQEVMPILGFAILVAVSTWLGALQTVFRCALYIYATEGVVPEPFTQLEMDSAWKIRGK